MSHICLLFLIPSYEPSVPPLAWTHNSPRHCPPSLHPGPRSLAQGGLQTPPLLQRSMSHNPLLTWLSTKEGLRVQGLEADNPGSHLGAAALEQIMYPSSIRVFLYNYLIKLGDQTRRFSTLSTVSGSLYTKAQVQSHLSSMNLPTLRRRSNPRLLVFHIPSYL